MSFLYLAVPSTSKELINVDDSTKLMPNSSINLEATLLESAIYLDLDDPLAEKIFQIPRQTPLESRKSLIVDESSNKTMDYESGLEKSSTSATVNNDQSINNVPFL